MLVDIASGPQNKTEQRMVPVWHDEKGAPQNVPTNFPVLDFWSPAVHIKRFFVTPESAVNKGAKDNSTQRVIIDADGLEAYPYEKEFLEDMDRLLNRDRITFLVEHINEHGFLTDNLRKYHKKNGNEKTIEKLMDALTDSNNSSQFEFFADKPKHKIFKRQYQGPKNHTPLHVTPADEEMLEQMGDESAEIRQFLEARPDTDKMALNLLDICLPCATDNHVKVSELNKLNSGAVASVKYRLHSLWYGRDGMHTITGGFVGMQILTNGPSRESSAPVIDLMDQFRQPKRPRIESNEEE